MGKVHSAIPYDVEKGTLCGLLHNSVTWGKGKNSKYH